MELAVDRRFLKVIECIVHPAHHPFHTKAKSAGMNWVRHPGKRSTFLGNCVDAFEVAVKGFIEVFMKLMAARYSLPPYWFYPTHLLCDCSRDIALRLRHLP